MAIPVGSSLNLAGNEIQNALIHKLAAAPGSPTEGQIYYDTGTHTVYIRTNSAWRPLDAAKLTDGSIPLTALASTPVIANGAITGATKTKVTYDAKGLVTAGADATTADINDSTNRRYVSDAQLTVIGNTSGTNTGDSASIPVGYLDTDTTLAANSDSKVATQKAIKAYVDAVAQGLLPKNAVQWVTAAALPSCTYSNGASGVGATLTATANGALTVDGGSPVVGDRIVVKDQASGLQNGIYEMTQLGTGGAPFILTRTLDANTSAEIKGAHTYCVPGGTANGNQQFTNTNSSSITIGTTAITFTQSSGVADITNGNGISKSGNTLSIDTSVTVDKNSSQTLTNKTLTSPVINTPTGIVKGDVGLGNVDNTSDATKNAAVATLTNKTLTSPVINTPTGLVKGDVGLGNVDNTSDATKNAAAVTLTNKTINGSNNTISNITEAMLSFSDNTTLNLSTTQHGLAPKAPNDTTKFLRGDATWAAVPGGLTKFSATITGDSSTTAFTVTDNIGSLVKVVQVYDSSGNQILVDNRRASTTTTTITFGVAPGTGVTYTVVVIG